MAAVSVAALTDLASPGERVLSALAAARSLSVTTGQCRVEMVSRHTVEQGGRVVLDVRADSLLAVEIASAPFGELPATLEFTDVAPIAVRDRVRARLTLSGCLSDEARDGTGDGDGDGDETSLRFETAQAVLQEGATTTLVPVDELAATDPDPLAEMEAVLLIHLDDVHPDAVTRLTRLLEPRLIQFAQRVRPLRVDRYGIVLRVERPRGHDDARIPFATPLRSAADVGFAFQHLLARAGSCPRRRRST